MRRGQERRCAFHRAHAVPHCIASHTLEVGCVGVDRASWYGRSIESGGVSRHRHGGSHRSYAARSMWERPWPRRAESSGRDRLPHASSRHLQRTSVILARPVAGRPDRSELTAAVPPGALLSSLSRCIDARIGVALPQWPLHTGVTPMNRSPVGAAMAAMRRSPDREASVGSSATVGPPSRLLRERKATLDAYRRDSLPTAFRRPQSPRLRPCSLRSRKISRAATPTSGWSMKKPCTPRP